MSTQPALADATEVRDHWWWRPGWQLGQRAYTWHLTFAGQAELHRLAAAYQSAMSSLAQVDPVPIEWLHLTMQGVGFPADISADQVDRVADGVRERLAHLPPVRLTFHRPVLLPEAVALPPAPAQPVHDIRSAVRAGIADVWGKDAVPEVEDGFRAHVSVGYVNADGPAGPILAALRSVQPEPATVTVQAASLILLDRDTRVYRWSVVQEVPLGAASAS